MRATPMRRRLGPPLDDDCQWIFRTTFVRISEQPGNAHGYVWRRNWIYYRVYKYTVHRRCIIQRYLIIDIVCTGVSYYKGLQECGAQSMRRHYRHSMGILEPSPRISPTLGHMRRCKSQADEVTKNPVSSPNEASTTTHCWPPVTVAPGCPALSAPGSDHWHAKSFVRCLVTVACGRKRMPELSQSCTARHCQECAATGFQHR